MSVSFCGGCACGAIRYECSAEPLLSEICYCRDCQRSSGNAFAFVSQPRSWPSPRRILGRPGLSEPRARKGCQSREAETPQARGVEAGGVAKDAVRPAGRSARRTEAGEAAAPSLAK